MLSIGVYDVQNKTFLRILFFVVLANFLVQILYLIHQYQGVASLAGSLLMMVVFAWFLAGYILLSKRTMKGFVIMLAFLITEFLFYLSTQVTQAVSGQGILLHVLRPSDPILFIVFGVGYANFVAAGFCIFYMTRHRQGLVR